MKATEPTTAAPLLLLEPPQRKAVVLGPSYCTPRTAQTKPVATRKLLAIDARKACRPSLIAPYPFFIGIACSFVACCLLGFIVRDRNCYEKFSRFHRLINPESHFYPT